MKKLLQNFFGRLWNDELFARRWGRAALMAVAAGGLAFADQLASVIDSPGAVKTIKVMAILAGLASAAITAGEKNPRPEV
jgi:hypothetical protein